MLGEHGPSLVARRLHDSLTKEIGARVVAPLLRVAPEGAAPLVPPAFLAAYLTGALLAAYRWWLARDCPESSEELDILVQHANRPVLLHTLGLAGGQRALLGSQRA
jgi:hypothetical protein